MSLDVDVKPTTLQIPFLQEMVFVVLKIISTTDQGIDRIGAVALFLFQGPN